MAEDVLERWDRFLSSFFGAGNRLAWPSDLQELEDLVRTNAEGLHREVPGPFVLPRVGHDHRTTYYAIATSDDQAHDLRSLLAGIVGPTYTSFDGRPIQPDVGDQVLQAAIDFAGSPSRVFGLAVVNDGAVARRVVRQQIGLLLTLVQQRPERRVMAIRPIGRLLRDFDRALTDQDSVRAEELLFGPITATGRLSSLNRLFLHVRLLAAFERWDELENLPSLNDLLRISRPALVSDALATLASARLDSLERELGLSRKELFRDRVAPRFGALVPSVDQIRSAVGANYYALWQLAQGENPTLLRDRLRGLDWDEDGTLGEFASEGGREQSAAPIEVTPDELAEIVIAGRFDAAIGLLNSMPAEPEYLPALLRAASQTLSMSGLDAIARYRRELGDATVDRAVERLHQEGRVAFEAEQLARTSWAARVQQVAAGDNYMQDALSLIDQSGLLDLARDQRQLDELVASVQSTLSSANPEPVLDVVLELLRMLRDVLPERDVRRLRSLRLAVIRLWSLSDVSGDQTRASDVLDEVELLIGGGCSTEEYDELVDLLTYRWKPFLSDTAFGLGVRALEIFTSGRPAAASILSAFATPLFARMSPSSVGRVDVADFKIAESLSIELDLGLTLPALEYGADSRIEPLAGWQGLLGIYSLDESALQRAARVLKDLLPSADIRTAHELVSSDQLRSLATNADLMVVATQKAKHAATDAIRAARGARDLTFPRGKGSSSLVRAVLESVRDQLSAA